MMSNKVYDVLKWIAQILLPALGTLYFALAGIWNFPYAEAVVGTITAVDTFVETYTVTQSKTVQITATSSSTEYVYIPLGGNRIHHYRNLCIVWILTGLWHGAAWNFVLWGLYYGLLLLFEKYVFSRIKIPKAIGWVYTTILVLIGWVLFSSENLPQCISILGAMFGAGTGLLDKTAMYYLTTGGLILLVCALCSTPLLGFLKDKLLRRLPGRILVGIIYVGLFALSLLFLVVQNYNPFLYFRF